MMSASNPGLHLFAERLLLRSTLTQEEQQAIPDLPAQTVALRRKQDFVHVVLADAPGMTAVHINRVLKELRLNGAMALKRGSVILLDARKLVQIAGFDENYLHRRLRQVA